MKASAFNKKITLYVWLLVLLVSGILFYANFISNSKINSDISSILPQEQQEAAELNQLFNQLAAKNVIWMLKGKQQHVLVEAAKNIESILSVSNEIAIRKNDSNGLQALYQLLLKHPAAFLSLEDSEKLAADSYQALSQSRIEQLFSPLASLDSNRLQHDPLQLAENYIKEVSSHFNAGKQAGSYLVYKKDAWHYLLINIELTGSPFDLELQKAYLNILSKVTDNLDSDIELLQLGVIGFSASETQQGMFEAQFIGVGSLLVICLLLLLIFRSFVPILLMMLVLGISVVFALSMASLLFANIHILSVLVGASLIGIAVDYVFHYLAKNTYYSPEVTTRKILKPVSLGLVTSVLGYLALYFSGLIVLKQIALISSLGLFAAYVSTLLILPRLNYDLSSNTSIKNAFFTCLNSWVSKPGYKKAVIAVASFIVIMGVILLPRLSFNDDLKLLHASPEYLKQQQLEIESVAKDFKAGTNLIFKADELQALLELLEQYNGFFEHQKNEANLDSFISPHQLLSSHKTQMSNQSKLSNWIDSAIINNYLGLLEIDDKTALAASIKNSSLVSLEDMKATPFATVLNQMLIIQDKSYYGLVKLTGVKDLEPFQQLAQAQTDILLLDTKSSFSNFLQEVRVSSIELVLYAYLAIFIILIVIYGLKGGALVFLPPLAAAIFAILFAAALGQALNVFHIVALTLVLGIGIDYTIFYASANDSKKPDMVMAISCSMLSTVLAFGLMSFSQTPAVSGFGTIVLLGMLMVYILAPMAKRGL